MKAHPLILSAISLWMVAPGGLAETAEKAPSGDALTEQELAEKLKKAPKPLAVFQQVETKEDPSVVNRPGDLLSRSDILCLGDFATLVPKRAILHRPKALLSRIGMKEGSKIQIWSEFYAANRGWISTVEVSRAQAEGKEPFPEDTMKTISRSSSIVVATYKGGPISVLSEKFAESENASKAQ